MAIFSFTPHLYLCMRIIRAYISRQNHKSRHVSSASTDKVCLTRMSSLSTINNIVNQRNHYYYVNPMQWSSKFGIEEFKSSQRIPSETDKLNAYLMVLFVRKKTLLTSASCNEQIKEISFLLAELTASNTLKGLTFTNKAELLD